MIVKAKRKRYVDDNISQFSNDFFIAINDEKILLFYYIDFFKIVSKLAEMTLNQSCFSRVEYLLII